MSSLSSFRRALILPFGVADMHSTSTLSLPPSLYSFSSELVTDIWGILLPTQISYLDAFCTPWTSLLPQQNPLQPGHSPPLSHNILSLYPFPGAPNVVDSVPWVFLYPTGSFGGSVGLRSGVSEIVVMSGKISLFWYISPLH